MLVTIICVANPDNTGIDVDRINKVEDLPAEIAQKMLDGGTGRVPSETELSAYRDALNAEPEATHDDGGAVPSGIATASLDTYEPTALPTASE